MRIWSMLLNFGETLEAVLPTLIVLVIGAAAFADNMPVMLLLAFALAVICIADMLEESREANRYEAETDES